MQERALVGVWQKVGNRSNQRQECEMTPQGSSVQTGKGMSWGCFNCVSELVLGCRKCLPKESWVFVGCPRHQIDRGACCLLLALANLHVKAQNLPIHIC